MWPLQSLELQSISPYALVLLAYVFFATVRWHIKRPEQHPDGWQATFKGILLDAGEALLIILCIWILQYVTHHTIGGKYKVGGILLHGFLDYGHLAVLFRWMLRSLLRMLP